MLTGRRQAEPNVGKGSFLIEGVTKETGFGAKPFCLRPQPLGGLNSSRPAKTMAARREASALYLWNSNMNFCPEVRRRGSMGRRAVRASRKPARTKSQKAASLTRAAVMPIFRGSRRARLRLTGLGTEMKYRPLKMTMSARQAAKRPPAMT